VRIGAAKSGKVRRVWNFAEWKGTTMKTLVVLGMLALFGVGSVHGESLIPSAPQPYSADLLARVRSSAMTIPGAHPSGINYVKMAESHRPLADIIVGGSQERYVSARTAFQVLIRPAPS